MKRLAANIKTERLNLKVVAQNNIKQAAGRTQITPSKFNVRRVVERFIDEQCHFYLEKKEWEALCHALDQPPREIPALRKLAQEKTLLE